MFLLIHEKEKKNNELLKDKKNIEKKKSMMDTKLTDIKRFVDELQAGIQSMEETKYNLEFEKKENQKIFKVYENME